jgi:hypothetical protein
MPVRRVGPLTVRGAIKVGLRVLSSVCTAPSPNREQTKRHGSRFRTCIAVAKSTEARTQERLLQCWAFADGAQEGDKQERTTIAARSQI